jgi:mRNA-degrading endonuclease RelE of RelBE toxin-antitoxin system
MFELVFTSSAQEELKRLEGLSGHQGLVKQVKKTLGFLQTNPRHPSLQTHVFHSLKNPYPSGEKVFEAYVQQHTPAAYRLFWCYGPEKGHITIIAITPHP